MPESWHEFAGRELGAVLGISPGDAEEMLDLAWHLEVSLPGTQAAFRAGILSRDKAGVIARATALLDPAEARAAEARVLDRAGSLTPDALRAAIRRAVMDVNPEKARKRREQMAKRTRVERWAEDSGNAGLAGRELPPAEVLAADQRVTAWARQLRKAGLEGSMDQLRARAFMDILLGVDSRPLGSGPDGMHGQDKTGRIRQDGDGRTSQDGAGSGRHGSGPDERSTPAPGGPAAAVIPPGFAGRVTLTAPAATLLGLADRPGEMAGIGPIDPNPGANTLDRYLISADVPGQGVCSPGLGGPVRPCCWSRVTNWAAETMGIPRKEPRSCMALSPVTIRSARPAAAASSTRLSGSSASTVTCSAGSTVSAASATAATSTAGSAKTAASLG